MSTNCQKQPPKSYTVTDSKGFAALVFFVQKAYSLNTAVKNNSKVKLKLVRECTNNFDTPEQRDKKRTALKYRKKIN